MSMIKCKLIVLAGVLGVSLSAILVKYASAPSAVLAFYRMLFSALLLLPMVWRQVRPEYRQTGMEMSQIRSEQRRARAEMSQEEVFESGSISRNRLTNGLENCSDSVSKNSRSGEKSKIPGRKDLLLCCISGFFLACHFTSYFESIRWTSIASSTVLVDTEVFFVALVTVFIFKEKISRAGVAGILLTFAGSVVLALSDSQAGSNVLYGDFLAVAGALFVSVYTLIGRRQRRSMSTTQYTFLVYGASAVTLACFCLVSGMSLLGYSVVDYACAFGMAVFCTLLGHSVFSWGLKYIPAAFISTAKLGEPVFASILGLFLFGQVPELLQIAGGCIIIFGIWMYVCFDKQKV